MINKVTLIGNLGADPEVRTLQNGTKVAKIKLATTENIYNKETKETKENTEWHTVVLWQHMAEIAEKHFNKGSQAYIEGKIRTNSWEDKDGNKRYSTEIVAETIKLLGRKPGNATSNAAPAQHESKPSVEQSDDLPF